MKTEEDEAFDELARRQGDWGGGFQAKRAMAADKLQEPIYKITVIDNAHPKGIPFEDWVQPVQDVDYWIREATAARQAELALRRELEAQPAQREWVGLTDDEIDKTYQTMPRINKPQPTPLDFARAVEQLLKEKNG